MCLQEEADGSSSLNACMHAQHSSLQDSEHLPACARMRAQASRPTWRWSWRCSTCCRATSRPSRAASAPRCWRPRCATRLTPSGACTTQLACSVAFHCGKRWLEPSRHLVYGADCCLLWRASQSMPSRAGHPPLVATDMSGGQSSALWTTLPACRLASLHRGQCRAWKCVQKAWTGA
jgi:hypothetical protein